MTVPAIVWPTSISAWFCLMRHVRDVREQGTRGKMELVQAWKLLPTPFTTASKTRAPFYCRHNHLTAKSKLQAMHSNNVRHFDNFNVLLLYSEPTNAQAYRRRVCPEGIPASPLQEAHDVAEHPLLS